MALLDYFYGNHKLLGGFWDEIGKLLGKDNYEKQELQRKMY